MPRNPKCTKCSLVENTNPNAICTWGVGPSPCDIMLVGLALGPTENVAGKPFVGRAGTELDKVLDFYHIARNTLRITNLCRCLGPPTNKITPACVKACLPYLKEEIEEVKPKLILALGAEATKALTGKEGLVKHI